MKTDSTTYIVSRTESSVQVGDSVNSLDLFKEVRSDSSGIHLFYEDIKPVSSTRIDVSSGHVGIKKAFSLEQVDGVLALLLMCFLFQTRIYKGGFRFLKENSRLVFSSRENANLFSETTITEFWYNFAMIFQTTLLASIVLFSILIESNYPYVPSNSFVTILLFILAIGAVEGLKFLYYRLAGYIFNVQTTIDIWLRSYIIIIELMGIIAFLPVLMLVYSNDYHEVLTIFFIILFIASRLIIFYRIIIFFLRENVNFLYLIVYLCSVEIIPYILLYKGLTYIYQIDIISLLWH